MSSAGRGHDPAEVRAGSMIHYHGVRDSAAALILLQYRPQAIVVPSAVDRMRELIMGDLARRGWESPALFFRGGHLATRGKVGVLGSLDAGELQLVTVEGDVVYEGPVERPTIWAAVARRAGSIGVIGCADPALDHLDYAGNIEQLAEEGKLLAAVGLFPPTDRHTEA